MKKALVLGVLAIFAINIATVETVNAQDKKSAPAKNTTKKVVKPKAAKFEAEKTAKGEAKAVKCDKVEDAKEDAIKKNAEPEKPVVNQEQDPTSKNVTNNTKKATKEVGVPPTPNKTKKPVKTNKTKPQPSNEK